VHGAELFVALTGLPQKRGARWNRSAGQRFSDRTVTGHYRRIVDISLRIAEEAKAVDQLISEIEALRAKSGGAGAGTQSVSACGMFGLG